MFSPNRISYEAWKLRQMTLKAYPSISFHMHCLYHTYNLMILHSLFLPFWMTIILYAFYCIMLISSSFLQNKKSSNILREFEQRDFRNSQNFFQVKMLLFVFYLFVWLVVLFCFLTDTTYTDIQARVR